MDSAAYLRKHGWQGAGSPLHPHKSGSLRKPLLVSKKIDVLGLGLNKNDSVSDQWWLRAFDSSLKSLGTGQKGALDHVREQGVKRGGLYGRFVKGQDIPGTIEDSESGLTQTQKDDSETTVAATVPASEVVNMSKRKLEDGGSETATKRQKKIPPLQEHDKAVTAPGQAGSKAEKYERKKAKREAKRAANKADASAWSSHTQDINGTLVQTGENPAQTSQTTSAKERKQKRKQERKEIARVAKEERKRLKKIKRAEVKAIKDGQDVGMKQVHGLEGLSSGANSNGEARPAHSRADDKGEKKLLARAIEERVEIDCIGTRKDREVEAKRQVDARHIDQKRCKKMGIDAATYAALPTKQWDVLRRCLQIMKDLEGFKRQQYQERAKQKGQDLFTYVVARTLKNDAAQGTAAQQESNTAKLSASGPDFVVDNTQDTSLAPSTDFDMSIFKKKNADLAMAPEEILARIKPAMWEGRIVKDLSRDIRDLRRIWLRARRRMKRAEGPKAGARIDKQKTKDQRKIERQERLSLDILKYSRRVKFGPASKQGKDHVAAETGPDPVVQAAKDRANQVGAEWIPLDDKVLESTKPAVLPEEPPPLGPNGEPYPVINVEHNHGMFQKLESKLARKEARRMIRHEKQREKRGPKAEGASKKKGRKASGKRV